MICSLARGVALWGHALHAAAVHTEDAAHALHLLQESCLGEQLPARGDTHGRGQPHHCLPPSFLVR